MKFLKNGKLTDEGKALIEHLQSQATDNIVKFNQLPGHIRHFLTMTESGVVSHETWIEDYSNAASAAWDDMQQLRETAEKDAQEENDKTALTEGLAQLREELGGQIADLKKENSTLKGQMTKLKKQLKESAEDVEDETEEEDSDDKPEESTPDKDGDDAGESDE